VVCSACSEEWLAVEVVAHSMSALGLAATCDWLNPQKRNGYIELEDLTSIADLENFFVITFDRKPEIKRTRCHDF
jgi:hypothetical protein